MPSYRQVLLPLAALSLATGVYSDAASKCRSLHHVDVDPGTTYLNSQCLLRCIIHGKTSTHAINEGFPCPLASTGTCHNGKCIQSAPRVKLGHIDIEIVSASLSVSAHAYATACIQNSTVPLGLPIHNRASCITCSSKLLSSPTKTPAWHSVCTGSSKFSFVADSRVTFEIWDHLNAHNSQFLGGAVLTIAQLLNHQDNHKELHLALSGGKVSGKLSVLVTWTPS